MQPVEAIRFVGPTLRNFTAKFNHLVDQTGQKRLNKSVVSLSSAYWQVKFQ